MCCNLWSCPALYILFTIWPHRYIYALYLWSDPTLSSETPELMNNTFQSLNLAHCLRTGYVLNHGCFGLNNKSVWYNLIQFDTIWPLGKTNWALEVDLQYTMHYGKTGVQNVSLQMRQPWSRYVIQRLSWSDLNTCILWVVMDTSGRLPCCSMIMEKITESSVTLKWRLSPGSSEGKSTFPLFFCSFCTCTQYTAPSLLKCILPFLSI